MKTRTLPLLPLVMACVGCVFATGAPAQEAAPKRVGAAPVQTVPVLVGGSEFLLMEVPVAKPAGTEGKKRLPLSIVVLLWVVAMVLWQIYFNRKKP